MNKLNLRKKAELMRQNYELEIEEIFDNLDYGENKRYIDLLYAKKFVLDELLEE